jgi:hypothetical protein
MCVCWVKRMSADVFIYIQHTQHTPFLIMTLDYITHVYSSGGGRAQKRLFDISAWAQPFCLRNSPAGQMTGCPPPRLAGGAELYYTYMYIHQRERISIFNSPTHCEREVYRCMYKIKHIARILYGMEKRCVQSKWVHGMHAAAQTSWPTIRHQLSRTLDH